MLTFIHKDDIKLNFKKISITQSFDTTLRLKSKKNPKIEGGWNETTRQYV